MTSLAKPIELYHECYGEGRPLLCIHGFGASLYSWRNFIEPFSKTNQLLLIDLKGCGKSPKPKDTKYSTLDHAELILQFILERDLNDLTLVGNSLGGAISLLITILLMEQRALARLRSIILIDAGAYKEYIPLYLRLLSVTILNLPAYLLPSRLIAERVLRMAYYDPEKITQEQIAAYAAPLSEPGSRHALLETAKRLVPPNFDELVAKYKEIKVPTLIIWGRQDKIIPLKVGEMLDRDIPNSTLKVIEQCGHAPQEERPHETVELVSDFLKSL